MGFAIVLIALFVLIRGFVLGPFHYLNNPKGKFFSRKPTALQRKQLDDWARNILEKNPHDDSVNKTHPHILREIQLRREYENLTMKYDKGIISKLDFELELMKITNQINLEIDFVTEK